VGNVITRKRTSRGEKASGTRRLGFNGGTERYVELVYQIQTHRPSASSASTGEVSLDRVLPHHTSLVKMDMRRKGSRCPAKSDMRQVRFVLQPNVDHSASNISCLSSLHGEKAWRVWDLRGHGVWFTPSFYVSDLEV
jgi:hypothetical protein